MSIPQPTEEMVEYFSIRTKQHIDRVRGNLSKMVGFNGITKEEIISRSKAHDITKYGRHEKLPYIWLTWMHYQKRKNEDYKLPEEMNEPIGKAIEHHKQNNLHHPEAHEHPNKMSTLDLLEMVCDWTAMSQEYGKSSCIEWTQENVENWEFSKEKKKFIFHTIDELDHRNGSDL